MRYRDILTEKAIRLDADGHPLTVLQNPSIQQVLMLLDRSPDEQVKGLMIGDDVYFWSATSVATHGHVAAELWPTDGNRNYWEEPDYVDSRLLIELDNGHPTIDFDPSLFNNARVLALLKTDEIYFNFPGAGFLNYSEYVENDKQNEKQRLTRQARAQAYDAQRQAETGNQGLTEIDRGGELDDVNQWNQISKGDFDSRQADMLPNHEKDYEPQGHFDGLDVATLAPSLSSHDGTTYVVFRASVPVAYVTLETFGYHDNDYQVKSIRVAVSEQGKGLAPRFYRWLLTSGCIDRLFADDHQTDGGAKIWERLLQTPGVAVFVARNSDDYEAEIQGRRVRTVRGLLKAWASDNYRLYAEAG